MIEGEMLPVHNGSTTTKTGTVIKKFLKSKGADKRQLAGTWVKKAEKMVWFRNYSKLAKIGHLQQECAMLLH
ncbi:Hypothetical protein PHPALM_628 [Phytophthora palmivora]|uniref:Uncharacterized protein n=1 Tax=Phytophthora palmivora TaxID=4796 RepID=A0A2P4YUC8_9STRA|nr:Hypothetical protein PHPALM_628 [Phytophthora palmivora]